MKCEIVILQDAEKQLLEHFAWLEKKKEGLGMAFHNSCDRAFAVLADHPKIAPRYAGRYRRYLLRNWRVGIFYSHEGRRILVHAALNLQQSPENNRRSLGL